MGLCVYTGVSMCVVKVPRKKQCCFVGLSSLPSPSQGNLSLGISIAAPAIIIPCLLLIADTAGSQQDMLSLFFSLSVFFSLYSLYSLSLFLSVLSLTDTVTHSKHTQL
ncbi:hypothetical protein AMECASPLE_024479 [Ameca splendens]|uniref:Uncharacterized protein n=1 Tax=Ameca splendens TaxID=208324 RepID=A0ABV0ZP92_9TELE